MLSKNFFDVIRQSGLYNGRLSKEAVDGMNAVSVGFDNYKWVDKCADDLAAIMATVVIETGRNFNLSVEEGGKGKGKAYGKPAGPYNHIYYGRGPCQCTWLANYQTAKIRTGIDFVKYPERMCDPKYGVPYMIDGMFNGVFRRYRLRNFIKPGVKTSSPSFYDARNIINSKNDRAEDYARYCLMFQKALEQGGYVPVGQYVAERQPREAAKADVPPPSPVETPAPEPPKTLPVGIGPEDRTSFFGKLRNWFGG